MNMHPQPAGSVAAKTRPRRFVFVLLREFTMLSFACAVEPLRIANRMAGRRVYEWLLAGEGGDSVACSNGTVFKVDSDLGALERAEA
jgi:AraC family transcriptional regulator, glycine betaine-responsive activator